MENDVRKDYIISSAASFFSKDPNKFASKLAGTKHIAKFIDDITSLVLVCNKVSGEYTFTSKLDEITRLNGKSIVFFKTSDEPITDENMQKNILTSSIIDSPIDTLFHLIHNVYAPILQLQQSKAFRGSDGFDTKLTNNLADLESNLKTAIKRSETGESKTNSLSPLDEFQYWSEMAEKGKTDEAKERAAFFYSEFQPLIKYFKKIDVCPIHEILEVIEATQDAYDFIWQQVDYEPTYSQERMVNLLEITSKTFLKALLTKLSRFKVFEDNFSDVKENLKHSISVCDRWIECCHSLTGRLWKSSQTHKWENGEFVPVSIVKYQKRISEVYQIRSGREQYLILLKTVPDDQQDQKENFFQVFEGLDPIQYNPFTEPNWQQALQQYDNLMVNIDHKAAEILKLHLRQAQSNPRQLLAEFLRYSDLVRREKVRSQLTSEREILIGQLDTFGKQMNEQLTTYLKSTKNVPTGKNMSATMRTIIWITQSENTLHEISKNIEFFLYDVAGYKNFQSNILNLINDFKRSKNDHFQEWCETTLEAISDNGTNISLETHGKLMELNHKDGKLDVLYGDRLITLLREVKQLQSYGFKIPKKVEECAKVSHHFSEDI